MPIVLHSRSVSAKVMNGSSPQEQVRTCLYCGKQKPLAELSLEHIFPQRLGGAMCSELFKTRDVCQRCNNILGAFVDGTFIKSWFVTNAEALASQQYLDIASPNSISPLMYMGILNGLNLPADEICEMWVGPCGCHFYHMHQRDDTRWDTYAGGNPMERYSDPGRVYVAFTTNHPQWVMLTLRSLKANFPRATRYACNLGFSEESAPQDFVVPLTAEAQREVDLINALPAQRQMNVPMNVAFEYRFLAKLALALGYKILGSRFLETSYAGHLRAALWEKDYAARANIPLRGSGFLSGAADTTAEFLAWPGAYMIRFHIIGSDFVLSLQLPSGTKIMHLVMADEPNLWQGKGFEPYRNGVLYLMLPQLARFVGPIGLPEYVVHRTNIARIAELADLERHRIDPATLPPCRPAEAEHNA